MGRAPCCDKVNVKKGPWSPEEDAKLKAYIEQHGTGGNWIALPQKIGLKRCGKSCRLRWLNYLRPDIKHGGFTEEEDNIICSLYISIGSRWSIIAAQLPGRTDNDIKNYWNTKLKKKLLGRHKQSASTRFSSPGEDPKGGKSPDDSMNYQALTESALERLQLHMQLQGLQSPFSLYHVPPFWPKLHPMQQKLIQNMMLNSSLLPHSQMPYLASLHQNDTTSLINNSKDDDHLSSSNGMSSSSGSSDCLMNNHVGEKLDFVNNTRHVMNDRPDLGFRSIPHQGEIDYLLPESRMGELDYFKEVDSYKESLSWLANSLDSTSMLQAEGMTQDYNLNSYIQ